MIELIATITGIVFGALGMLIAAQQHVRSLRKEWLERLEEERNRHSDAKVKAYAAERDFEHLRRHHEQLKIAVGMLQEDLDKLKDSYIESKTIIAATYTQLQTLTNRFVEGSCGLPIHRKD
jgi:GTP1/Obg family GTP-binding protein